MLMSRLFGERLREVPADAVLQSHVLLLKGGYARPAANGIFSLLPAGRKVIQNIESILREEMDALGCQEVLLPVVLPASLWEESGRYETVGSELMRFSDHSGRNLVLGMTHEEAAVQLARGEVKSYTQYPFVIYQIQTKFRDELRPRGGLLRTREFTMKDAYSFHTSGKDLNEFYQKMYRAYFRIFRRAGLGNILAVDSDTGMMGGGTAHEFMCLSESGEDTLYLCGSCGYQANGEVLEEGEGKCPVCGGEFQQKRGIELGHIFQLGDKYTKSMGMAYTARDGSQQVPLMGCYGIGLGRLMACVLEECRDERGPVWPVTLAPWKIQICVLGLKDSSSAFALYETLGKSQSVLLDDRNVSAGVQFADADLLGAPVRLILSKRTLEAGKAELSTRDGSVKELVDLENAEKAVKDLLGKLRQTGGMPAPAVTADLQ